MTVTLTDLTHLLPRISPESGITLAAKDGVQIVDYAKATTRSFSNPHEFECRGLKFDTHGQLLARPMHKIFALGEMQSFAQVDWQASHVVLEWLDGAMVHAIAVDGRLALMAREGRSALSAMAEQIAPVALWSLAQDFLDQGITPIFEVTGPDVPSVVQHKRTQITLIAARDTATGVYMSWAELYRRATGYGVALVRSYGQTRDAEGLVSRSRALQGAAGYVVAFDDGHRIILPSDWFTLRRRALRGEAPDRLVLDWIGEGAEQEALRLFDQTDAHVAAQRMGQILAGLDAQEAEIEQFLRSHTDLPRANAVRAAQDHFPPVLLRAVFAALDGAGARSGLMALIRWARQSEGRAKAVMTHLTAGGPSEARAA